MDNIIDLNNILNPEINSIALIKGTQELFRYDKIWSSIGNLITLKGDKGDKGENGVKGENGKSFEIKYIINDLSELLDKVNDVGTFAVEKNLLNIYYNKDKKWILLGNLKGEKGNIGERGKTGEKGDIGKGLKIDYYFDSIDKLIASDISFSYGEVIYLKDKNELKFQDKDIIKDLGNLLYPKKSTMDLTLIPVYENHQDIDYSNLLEISHNLSFNEIKSFHKLKIIFCWQVLEEADNNFYKEGLLFFAEHENELIQNSVRFIQGFPFVNNFLNEFIIRNMNLSKIRFFIKFNYKFTKIKLLNNFNFLEIEKI